MFRLLLNYHQIFFLVIFLSKKIIITKYLVCTWNFTLIWMPLSLSQSSSSLREKNWRKLVCRWLAQLWKLSHIYFINAKWRERKKRDEQCVEVEKADEARAMNGREASFSAFYTRTHIILHNWPWHCVVLRLRLLLLFFPSWRMFSCSGIWQMIRTHGPNTKVLCAKWQLALNGICLVNFQIRMEKFQKCDWFFEWFAYFVRLSRF